MEQNYCIIPRLFALLNDVSNDVRKVSHSELWIGRNMKNIKRKHTVVHFTVLGSGMENL